MSLQRLSGDPFDCHIWNGVVMCAIGLHWVETKGTAKHKTATMAGQLPTIQNPLSTPPLAVPRLGTLDSTSKAPALLSACSGINGSGLC